MVGKIYFTSFIFLKILSNSYTDKVVCELTYGVLSLITLLRKIHLYIVFFDKIILIKTKLMIIFVKN